MANRFRDPSGVVHETGDIYNSTSLMRCENRYGKVTYMVDQLTDTDEVVTCIECIAALVRRA